MFTVGIYKSGGPFELDVLENFLKGGFNVAFKSRSPSKIIEDASNFLTGSNNPFLDCVVAEVDFDAQGNTFQALENLLELKLSDGRVMKIPTILTAREPSPEMVTFGVVIGARGFVCGEDKTFTWSNTIRKVCRGELGISNKCFQRMDESFFNLLKELKKAEDELLSTYSLMGMGFDTKEIGMTNGNSRRTAQRRVKLVTEIINLPRKEILSLAKNIYANVPLSKDEQS